jgi:hypothetical protein
MNNTLNKSGQQGSSPREYNSHQRHSVEAKRRHDKQQAAFLAEQAARLSTTPAAIFADVAKYGAAFVKTLTPSTQHVLDLVAGRDFTNAAWLVEGPDPRTISIEPGTLRHDGTGGAQLVTLDCSNSGAPDFGFGTSNLSLYQINDGYTPDTVVNPTLWVKRVLQSDSGYGTLTLTGFTNAVSEVNWVIDLNLLPDDNWHQIVVGSPYASAAFGSSTPTMGSAVLPVALFGFNTGDVIAGLSISGSNTSNNAPLTVYLDAATCQED